MDKLEGPEWFDENSEEFHRELLGEDEKNTPVADRIIREMCEEHGWDYDLLVDREVREEPPASEPEQPEDDRSGNPFSGH